MTGSNSTGREPDIIVIGAGAAGCVLAARLSEDPDTDVLLLESGADRRPVDSVVPAAFAKMFRSRWDWDLTTVPQRGLAGRQLYWPRGRLVGGSTAMNAQMYVRGQRADFDGWAEDGAQQWDHDNVLPWFHRLEGSTVSDAPSLGVTGPVSISELRDPRQPTLDFLRAAEEVGIPRAADINAADAAGASLTPVTQRAGLRWSAADAYLRPARRRRNLTVATDEHVLRVVVEGGVAVGVEVASATGTRIIRAARGVVLAAGSIGSPEILLRSGIGPADDLADAGVDVVLDLPAVGRNLQDHLCVVIARSSDLRTSLASAEQPQHLLNLLFRRRGPLTSNVAEALALVRSTEDVAHPDLELLFGPVPYLDHGLTPPPGHGHSVAVVLLDPRSRGSVRLDPLDPDGPVRIDPGYLGDDDGEDLRRLRLGVRRATHLLDAPAFDRYAARPLRPAAPFRSDGDIESFIRSQAETLYHPVGTARIGLRAEDSVVDPSLRVHGIVGLMVMDASVMPRIVRGHTQAATFMIAERGAALLRTAGFPPSAAFPHQTPETFPGLVGVSGVER